MKAFLMLGSSWMGEEPVYGVIIADSAESAVETFKERTGIHKGSFRVIPSNDKESYALMDIPLRELKKSCIPSIADARYMIGQDEASIQLNETWLLTSKRVGRGAQGGENMKLFYARVTTPYICDCDELGEHIAWNEPTRLIVPAISEEETRKKIRGTLPSEDSAVKKILIEERPGTEYFQITVEGELQEHNGVFVIPRR